jgi:hypothetical protein
MDALMELSDTDLKGNGGRGQLVPASILQVLLKLVIAERHLRERMRAKSQQEEWRKSQRPEGKRRREDSNKKTGDTSDASAPGPTDRALVPLLSQW